MAPGREGEAREAEGWVQREAGARAAAGEGTAGPGCRQVAGAMVGVWGWGMAAVEMEGSGGAARGRSVVVLRPHLWAHMDTQVWYVSKACVCSGYSTLP